MGGYDFAGPIRAGGPTYEVVVATKGVPPSASWQTNGAQDGRRRHFPAIGGGHGGRRVKPVGMDTSLLDRSSREDRMRTNDGSDHSPLWGS